MRVIRLGDETAAVGTDLRAALASWGRGDEIVGGIALLGVRPPDCPAPIEAVLVLPRGVIVVAGVDLPDPAVQLDAPLAGQWTTDGWPLVRPDGAINPAAEALAAAAAVTSRLHSGPMEPLPVGLVVAVGPYVSRVSQPTADLMRGVRILHPEPMTLLTAARELATHPRPCTVSQIRQVLAVLHPDEVAVSDLEFAAEGFRVGADPGAEATTLIPKIAAGSPRARATATDTRTPRWLPITAALLLALLLITGIAVAIGSAGGDTEPRSSPDTTRSETIAVDGVGYAPKGVASHPECATHTFGDVRAWLEKNGCARLIRARFEASADGKRAAVLVSVLRFTKSASATELRTVADKPGAGGVSDQAVEGVAWPDGHKPVFESSAYASGRDGNSVKIVQAVWLDHPSKPDDKALRDIAIRALQLTPTT
ncbi:MAG: hypothetical protein M3548_18865 [Actinomycetota bacterium]|nr:hypothetical protein [Actinomycetota bacterium]